MIRKSLDTAEETWRDIIRVEYPLFASMPVIKASEDPKKNRPWMFYTDGKTTHMDVFKPKEIEEHFRRRIISLYKQAYKTELLENDIERIVHDNYVYLFFHEQFHPTYCPDSKHDEELIDAAIFKGIKKAEPHLQESDILRKLGNVRNTCWDQVIDTAFFFLSNYGNSLEDRIEKVIVKKNIPLTHVSNLPDGVVTIFDLVEFENHKDKFESLYYPLSRAVYAFLFTESSQMRTQIFDYFKNRITQQMALQEFDSAIQKSIQGFVDELDFKQLNFAGIDKGVFHARLKRIYNNYKDSSIDVEHAVLVRDIANLLLDKRSRYDAIKGFIIPLSKYISLTQEEKRHGTHIGQSSAEQTDQQTDQNQPGGNTEQALINLANVLDPKETNSLLAAIANGTHGGKGKNARLHNLANDEYYKRNAKEIKIRSPDYNAVQVILGKKRIPVYQFTRELTVEDIPNLPLDEILNFQQETGIIQLFALSEHRWRFDIYSWVEKDDIDYTFDTSGLDIPDNIVFHNDSSSSMGSSSYTGTNCSYNTLMHIETGILKTIKKAAAIAKKNPLIIAANFSNKTIVSDAIPLDIVYDTPNNSVKTILSGFQGGGTTYTASAFDLIESKLQQGKTVHIFVTDGALEETCIPATLERIKGTIQRPSTSFLYFELGTKTSFGKQLEALANNCGNFRYYGNVQLEDIEKKSLEVLLTYEQSSYNILI